MIMHEGKNAHPTNGKTLFNPQGVELYGRGDKQGCRRVSCEWK